MNTLPPQFSQNLDLRQGQQLVMTPQLQQAIKLLQLNNMELAEFVEEQLSENPLLEKDDKSPDGETEAADPSGDNDTDNIEEAFDTSDKEPSEIQSSDFDSGSSMADIGAGGNSKFEEALNSFEERISSDKSLREHLTEQLFVACDDPRDRMIGGLLIDQIDEGGYIRTDREELAERLGCSAERIDKLLSTIKSFDPTGIGANGLAECLALQLDERGQLDAPMKTLLDNLDMLANHDIKGLQDKCGVNDAYLADMIAEIKSLNPKPAAEFDHMIVQTAIPDVLMKRRPRAQGGGWRVELNTETLPRVLINQEYYTDVITATKDKKDREYITGQMHNASWLVKALDQRAQTILKVAAEIIEQQDAFFNYGIEFLKPLTLKDIAEEIEMHESTVSRVTTNKYIGTPRGLFELKYFFSTALISEDGQAHSSEAIKSRIKTMIDNEDPKKILSDDKIVQILKGEGIDLARRTVAKYREAMHIGSSVQRRKQKKNLS